MIARAHPLFLHAEIQDHLVEKAITEDLVRAVGVDAEVDLGLQGDGLICVNRKPLPTRLVTKAETGSAAALARLRDQLEVGVGVGWRPLPASHPRITFSWRWHRAEVPRGHRVPQLDG